MQQERHHSHCDIIASSHCDVTAVTCGHPVTAATKFTVKFQLPTLG